MVLSACEACPNFTYNQTGPSGLLCDPCRDALTYVQTAPVDDLRDLITGGQS